MTRAACTSTFDAARAPIVKVRRLPPSQPHAVGRVVAILDLDDLSGLEVVPLDEAQELGILIADALDRHRGVKRAGEERVVARPADRAVRVRNRIAVRIDRRPPEHFVDPVDQPIRHGMLQVLRLVVDLGPAHSHDPHEKQFDQAVPAQDQRGELFARSRQPDAGVGLVTHQPRLGQRLHHRGGGSGRDPQSRRELSHRNEGVRRNLHALGLEYGLQIVFDGGGGQH